MHARLIIEAIPLNELTIGSTTQDPRLGFVPTVPEPEELGDDEVPEKVQLSGNDADDELRQFWVTATTGDGSEDFYPRSTNALARAIELGDWFTRPEGGGWKDYSIWWNNPRNRGKWEQYK